MAEKILIGKVVSVVGIKGEIKIYNYSDQERFLTLKKIILSKKGVDIEYQLTKARNDGNTAICKLKGVDDRNQAESLRDFEVYITEKELRDLPNDTYYIRDLIGCEAIDISGILGEGELTFGVIIDVYQNSAQDNYEVKLNDGKKILIPGVKEFVKEVDIKNKKIKFKLIHGFIDGAVEA